MYKYIILFALAVGICSAHDHVSFSFVEAAKKTTPAVVSIDVKIASPGPSGPPATASGFLVSSNGYILTNNHVVSDASEITVTLKNNQTFKAKIVGRDPQTDVALIKINASDLSYLKLGDSDDIEVGQWVLAVGNPLGLQTSVSTGIISAKGRSDLNIANIEDFIQTDAAINMGNSGGPLVNLNGEVIGINTAIASKGGEGAYMGIAFAVPSNIAKSILEQILATGEVSRGYLGIQMQNVEPDLAQSRGLSTTEGALVVSVQKSSPAEKAGIAQGDIILKVNEQPVRNKIACRSKIALMEPGDALTLSILKGGNPKTITVELGETPRT